MTDSGRSISSYRVESALIAASVIDQRGSRARDARQSYHYITAEARYPAAQLREGEGLLRQLGLLVEEAGELYPTEALKLLAEVPVEIGASALLMRAAEVFGLHGSALQAAASELIQDATRREAFLLAVARRFDPKAQRELGEQGEELVVSRARLQLRELGRDDLARRVHRVSLVSDQLGYDVTAPRLDGTVQLLEVKTFLSTADDTAHFYLSRNEADTGLRFREWVLIACTVPSEGEASVVGWCSGASLRPYLPLDGSLSTWRNAHLTIPKTLLVRGFPDLA